MRFAVTGEWTRNHLLMLVICMFLAYTALFWVTAGAMYFDAMGLSYQSVVDYYHGNEEKFTQPRTFKGMLEVSHFHFFAMGMLLLTLTHLVLFVPISQRMKVTLIVTTFASALAGELSGWLVRFVHPGFAYVKIGAFLALECSLAVTLVLISWAIVRGVRAHGEADKRAAVPPPRPVKLEERGPEVG